MSELKKRGIRALAWDFGGKIVKQGMGLIISVILARLLGPEQFGLIAMVTVFIGMAAIFTDVGLGSALIQKRRLHPVHYSSVFFFNVAIGLFLTILTWLLAPWLAEFYHQPAVESIARVLAFSFLINSLGAVQSTKLRKELNYAVLTKARLASSFISGVLGITMAFYGFGVWSLVAQSIASAVIYLMFVWRWSGWRPDWIFSTKALKSLWGFGFRMFLARIIDTFFMRLDYMMIGKLFPIETLGYFQRAKALNLMVVKYSSGSLMSVLFPLLSRVQHDKTRLRNIVMKALGLLSFVVFFIIGGLYTTANEIILILFGPKWISSVDYFKILVLSGFAYPVSALLLSVLSSRGNSKDFLRLEIYKKMMLLVTFVVLYMYGINAFLYSMVLTSLVAVFLNARFAHIEIGISIVNTFRVIVLQALYAGVSSFFVLFFFGGLNESNTLSFFVKGVSYVVLYISINKLFLSESYNIFMGEIRPLLLKIKKGLDSAFSY